MKICVPSLGRALMSTTLKRLKDQGLLKDTYIFVYDFDAEAYRAQYSDATIVTVGSIKNLPMKRNKILEYGIENGWKTLLMIDDDIQSILLKSDDNRMKYTHDIALMNRLFEDIMEQIGYDFTVLAPRFNFILTDPLKPTKPLLMPYSQFSSVMYFNLEKLKDVRFDNVLLEDMDLYIKLNILGHKCYKTRHIQVANRLTQSGGLQDYTKVKERFSIGMQQMYDKYLGSEYFIQPTVAGLANFKGPRFKKYIKENYPKSYIDKKDIPSIINKWEEVDLPEYFPKKREKKEKES